MKSSPNSLQSSRRLIANCSQGRNGADPLGGSRRSLSELASATRGWPGLAPIGRAKHRGARLATRGRATLSRACLGMAGTDVPTGTDGALRSLDIPGTYTLG